MPAPRKRPRPDEQFVRIWYIALSKPVELPAATRAVATRIRHQLNQARLADRELYEMQHSDATAEGWPLRRMTTEFHKLEQGFKIIVTQDLAMLGALTAAGVLTDTPVDPDKALQDCEERLARYQDADFFQRARTGRLSPDDIFPLPPLTDDKP